MSEWEQVEVGGGDAGQEGTMTAPDNMRIEIRVFRNGEPAGLSLRALPSLQKWLEAEIGGRVACLPSPGRGVFVYEGIYEEAERREE